MASLCDTNSHFHKTVDLHEWWLIWCEDENNEKKLAIAGYTSRCQRPLRVFSSAPILRRHDVFTLETTDGVYVRIVGLVNKTRTEQNGFPSEVFKCFFFGFPPHWEVCARHYLAQGYASNGVSGEDARLKGSSQTIEESNTTNVGANVSPVSADPKLDKDQAVCSIKEGLQSVIYINEAGGAKDPGWKKTADIEMEINLKENADIKEASKSEKKTQYNVSSENASLKGCSNANAHVNERTDARANVSLATMDPELDPILEGLKNSSEALYFTRASGANDTDQRKTADMEQESNLKENAVIKEASVAEEKTYSNVPSEDASLKGCSNSSEQSNEMNNTNANVSLASTNPELDQDPTACPILEGLENPNEAVRYITRDCGAKDTNQRRTTDIELESNLKENAVIKEASIAEEKTCNNASTEDASLEGCSTASELINEMTSTEANVSIANLELELDQDHTACMNLEGLKNSNEAVRIITRAHGVKDTDQRETPAVEKESIMKENTASKEASTTGQKTCTDTSRRFEESSKKSQKAIRCRTRSGGARNTDRRRTATVKKENIEKAASKETSTPEKNIKRKLTYESPVTPKADVITSFISPELSSVKRSRSGRLLLPTLEFWRNQTAVYDPDHQVIGIKDETSMPSKELTHEPKRYEGRAQSKKDPNAATPNAATGKLKNESKKPAGRPRSRKNRAK